MTRSKRVYSRGASGLLTVLAVLALTASLPERAEAAKQADPPQVTHDGLHLKSDSKVAVAWVKPGLDLSQYKRFLILECGVAFKKDWMRDYNRDHRSMEGRVRDSDVERMKKGMSEMFKTVFVDELIETGTYDVVDAPAQDVLLIRPAIIDLDVTAPDVRSTGRSYTFTHSAGAATLFVEFYDSVSGEILARAVDRKAARNYGTMRWSTSVSNRTEAKRILRTWAGLVRNAMDEVHPRPGG